MVDDATPLLLGWSLPSRPLVVAATAAPAPIAKADAPATMPLTVADESPACPGSPSLGAVASARPISGAASFEGCSDDEAGVLPLADTTAPKSASGRTPSDAGGGAGADCVGAASGASGASATAGASSDDLTAAATSWLEGTVGSDFSLAPDATAGVGAGSTGFSASNAGAPDVGAVPGWS